ncbi:MAG TPA: MlaD family protein, partial [Solirubrobacteraceae bacterium]
MKRALPIGGLVLALVALVLVLRSGDDGRELRATFPSAVNLVEGAEVRAGGVKVGTVRAIELRGERAELRLRIDDDAWPLRAGTRAQIRLGGNVSYANRYIELAPGPGSGRALADGAQLPARDASSPLEFDELFNTFDARTRAGMGALIDRGAATFGPRAQELRDGLDVGGRGLGEGGRFLSELSADPAQLRTLLRTTAGTARALARRDGDLRTLVGATAETLTAIADSGDDVRATLRALPPALRTARGTLARTDRSLLG